MKHVIRRFIALTALTVGTPLFNLAQTNASNQTPQDQKARMDPEAPPDRASAPVAPPAAAKPELKPTVS